VSPPPPPGDGGATDHGGSGTQIIEVGPFVVGGATDATSGTGDEPRVSPAFGLVSLGVEWAIPAVVMTVPSLLIILVIVAQAMGAFAWIPLVQRNVGSLGLGRRRGPRRSGTGSR